ncbi:universal stress protein [Actinomycetospora cinnamomea]|uniref:Universal stress protein family protein n=1 Tax=Actinomycetospora cinnamomea TaxID=663609 RepID=A0A2U1F2B2_9PSEU|nr:universal stress protein [Actinomycetospora cinnamomea]PVZ06323.1 universal stress protein family protein [Actinomycetospora cinnamomea]
MSGAESGARAVVVGVSLEGHGETAVRWAAAEARDRGLPLRLVLGLVVPHGGYPGRGLVGVDVRTGLRALAQRELRDMHQAAQDIAPDVPLSEDLIESDAVAVLRAQARTASLVVVGNDGLGRLADLAVGGIARGLAGRIDVPLVVVPQGCDPGARDRAGGRAPVVVGDDGTPGSRGALVFAASRAARRGVPLVIVRAGPDARPLPEDAPELGPDRPPAVRVVIAEERADRVLAEQAREAELVVLGVGEHGWLRHRHHVRPGVVLHATCPVVVVPPGPPSATTPAGARAREETW